MADAVRVLGLAELERAFGRADRAVRADMRDALAEAAAPVRSDAQRLAGQNISRLGAGRPWSRMRIGVSRTVAYVAPVERGIKGRGGQRLRRPKFGTRLMNEAMQPALDMNAAQVERRVEKLIDEVANVWERT